VAGAYAPRELVDLPAQAGAQYFFNMFYVYIIKSCNENWYYVGLSNNLDRRIREHNCKKVRSTIAHAPFKLVYSKSFDTRVEARDYEKYLKVRSNKEKILRDLEYLV